MLDEKFKGMVSQDECLQILKYIYKDDDFSEISERLERSLQIVESRTTPQYDPFNHSSKDIRKQMMIKYKDFEKIILDFQLLSHRQFLSRFINMFRQYDANNFGYLDEDQFKELMTTVDPEQRVNLDSIMEAIDPQEMGVFPFSACVSVFSKTEMFEDADGITTIMHHIAGEAI